MWMSWDEGEDTDHAGTNQDTKGPRLTNASCFSVHMARSAHAHQIISYSGSLECEDRTVTRKVQKTKSE